MDKHQGKDKLYKKVSDSVQGKFCLMKVSVSSLCFDKMFILDLIVHMSVHFNSYEMITCKKKLYHMAILKFILHHLY